MADEVGAIVGYLYLRREDWIRGVRETEEDARRLGRLNPDIRIGTNASSVIIQLRAVAAAEHAVGTNAKSATAPTIGLVGALLSLAPAAIPIAAVATGAIAGLIPVAAAAALGILGIRENLKSGAYAGTIFGHNITSIKANLEQLKQTAAQGLIPGLNSSLHTFGTLMPTITREVHTFSGQLGNIAANVSQVLLRSFIQLNPLFTEFGNLTLRGAQALNHWSASSGGLTGFVAYAQAELPSVLHFLGELITLFGHLAQGAAPLGGVILGGLGILVHVLNAIPVNVLQVLIPLLESAYIGFKVFAGLTFLVGLMRSIGVAYAGAGASAASSALSIAASAAVVEAVAAQEAEVVAISKAEEASAAAEAALAIAASVAGTSSVLAEGAVAAANAATSEAVSFQLAADAAILSAEEITAAAVAASEAADAEALAIMNAGRAASIGFLGIVPIVGAVAVGLGILWSVMHHGTTEVNNNRDAVEGYVQTLLTSKGAIDANVRAQVAKTLADKGALASAQLLGVNLAEVTSGVTGNSDAMGKLLYKIAALHPEYDQIIAQGGKLTASQQKEMDARESLLRIISEQHDAFDASRQKAILEASATDGTATAMANAAYSTDQQTFAMQRANDAAGLLKQAFDALNGKTLDVNDANVAFHSSLLQVTDTLKKNGTTMDLNTAAGVANNQMISQALRAAQAHAEAVSGGTKLTGAGTAAYLADLVALRDHVKAVGGDTTEIQKMIDTVAKIPRHKLTTIEINDIAAKKAAADLKIQLDTLARDIWINIHTNNIPLGTVGQQPVRGAPSGGAYGGTVQGYAYGGTVSGPGGPHSDSIFVPGPNRGFALSNGEEVTAEPYASRYRRLLKAINSGQDPMRFLPGAAKSIANRPSESATSSRAGSGTSSTDMVQAVITAVMAELPTRIVFQSNDRELARAANNGNLRLNR